MLDKIKQIPNFPIILMASGFILIVICIAAIYSATNPQFAAPTPTPRIVIVEVTATPKREVIVKPTPKYPAGATAKCKDGTYSYSKKASGTCAGHKGVEIWINKP